MSKSNIFVPNIETLVLWSLHFFFIFSSVLIPWSRFELYTLYKITVLHSVKAYIFLIHTEMNTCII